MVDKTNQLPLRFGYCKVVGKNERTMIDALKNAEQDSLVIGGKSIGEILLKLSEPTGYGSTIFERILAAKVDDDYNHILKAFVLLNFYLNNEKCDAFDFELSKLYKKMNHNRIVRNNNNTTDSTEDKITNEDEMSKEPVATNEQIKIWGKA